MNLLLLPSTSPRQRIPANDPRLEHVRGVLRLKEGDTFDVGAENGPLGKACIAKVDTSGLELKIEWMETPPPLYSIDLLIALPRPATAKKIITEASTLGVRSIHFFPGGKSDPAYGRSRFWSEAGWVQARQLGVEQAFSTWLPEVTVHDEMNHALRVISAETFRCGLDVYEATQSLSTLSSEVCMGRAVAMALGPERGWDKNDRAMLKTHGFGLFSVGERVLRVETAVTVGLSLMLAKMGVL